MLNRITGICSKEWNAPLKDTLALSTRFVTQFVHLTRLEFAEYLRAQAKRLAALVVIGAAGALGYVVAWAGVTTALVHFLGTAWALSFVGCLHLGAAAFALARLQVDRREGATSPGLFVQLPVEGYGTSRATRNVAGEATRQSSQSCSGAFARRAGKLSGS